MSDVRAHNSTLSARDSELEVQPFRQCQREKILSRLIAAFPNEVSAIELCQISLQYSSRLFEIRRQGWVILNRVEIRDGKRYGYFKLASLQIQLNLFDGKATR